jgi:hypothetical protein
MGTIVQDAVQSELRSSKPPRLNFAGGDMQTVDPTSLKGRILHTVFRRLFNWRLQEFVAPRYLALLDYWPKLESRYGEGKPPHEGLAALFAKSDVIIEATLDSLLAYREDLLRIPDLRPPSGVGPFWQNPWLTGLDAIALYGLVASRRPARYIEVGSGMSTKFARQAITDHQLRTVITSIDPEPRAEIDGLCDEVVRAGLEDVDMNLFDRLESGDVLFVDNSHRVFLGSDVTVFFLDILPRLKPGVLVHIHDIMLPYDYPLVWKDRHYSEQYMLAAYLLGGGQGLALLLPVAYVEKHASFGKWIDAMWDAAVFQASFASNRKVAGYLGTSCWLTTR